MVSAIFIDFQIFYCLSKIIPVYTGNIPYINYDMLKIKQSFIDSDLLYRGVL